MSSQKIYLNLTFLKHLISKILCIKSFFFLHKVSDTSINPYTCILLTHGIPPLPLPLPTHTFS